ncbi:hypothetical protein, partial [Victivallis vadensis]|uniref:hypothetical protein n=1 Tax=Victivallis vadensis TaxID=172901 RepID=UPI0026DC82E0
SEALPAVIGDERKFSCSAPYPIRLPAAIVKPMAQHLILLAKDNLHLSIGFFKLSVNRPLPPPPHFRSVHSVPCYYTIKNNEFQ